MCFCVHSSAKKKLMLKCIKSCCLIVCIVIAQNVSAQTNDSLHRSKSIFQNLALSFDYYQGKMIKIYSQSPQVDKSRYYCLNILWKTNGQKYWHSYYGYPQVGLSVYYNYMGNDSILGRSLAFCPNMLLPIRRDKTWGFIVKLASGFAFFTKSYDKVSNPRNLVIGSRITNMTTIGISTFFKLTNHIRLQGGCALVHFSSGHVAIPNYGFNDAVWSAGIAFNPVKMRILPTKIDTVTNRKIHLNLRLSCGFQQLAGTASPAGGPKYPIYIVAPSLERRFGKARKLFVGVSAKYFTAYYDFMKSEHYFVGQERSHAWVYSAFVANEWMMGHVGYLLEASYKFYNPFYKKVLVLNDYNENKPSKQFLSLRTGFAYYLRDARIERYNPSIGLFINTNRTQADFVDFAINIGI